MNKVMHTPGPWVRDGHSLSTIIRCVVPRDDPSAKSLAGDYEVIARCPSENWDADSRLISAAPELLEAVKGMLLLLKAFVGPDDELGQFVITMAQNAITKAEVE